MPPTPVSSVPSSSSAHATEAADARAATHKDNAPPLHAASNRTLNVAWLVLLAITVTTWWMGGWRTEAATGSMVPVLVVCALTFVKGLLVSLEFLELRHAPALWRWLVCSWLAVVLLLIALAFWVSRW